MIGGQFATLEEPPGTDGLAATMPPCTTRRKRSSPHAEVSPEPGCVTLLDDRQVRPALDLVHSRQRPHTVEQLDELGRGECAHRDQHIEAPECARHEDHRRHRLEPLDALAMIACEADPEAHRALPVLPGVPHDRADADEPRLDKPDDAPPGSGG